MRTRFSGWKWPSISSAATSTRTYAVIAHRDQAVGAQFRERAIEVGNTEAECVAHHFLRQRHVKTRLRRKSDHLQPRMHLQQEMRKPLEAGCGGRY